MQQQYELGGYLRRRYTTSGSETYLFNGTYSIEEVVLFLTKIRLDFDIILFQVYVRSTNVDRTLMSAECQMASLYKPNGSQADH